jgi:glycosyltransferase involved in cell wall biosynthesis
MSDNQKLVSIALATYNGEVFIKKQLDSLLQQNYKNIEIIISDDNSSDKTVDIIKDYQKLDSRIHIILNKNQNGFKKNFEKAIEKCIGEITFLCDQDDVWYNNKIEEHLEHYKDNNIKWVYNEVRITDEFDNNIGTLREKFDGYYDKKLSVYRRSNGCCILGCATSYKTDALKKAIPINILAPGHDSWIQLVLHWKKSYHIKKILQDYRQHSNNVFGVMSKKTSNIEENINNNIKYLKNLMVNKQIIFLNKIILFPILCLKILKHKILKNVIKILR